MYYSRSADGGQTFSSPDPVSQATNNPGLPNGAAQLAVDNNGNVSIVWADLCASNWTIWHLRSSDGSNFGSPVNVANTCGETQGPASPILAIDSAGNINVVWSEIYDSTPPDVFFSRSADGGASFSVPLNISANSGTSNPGAIGVDQGGNIDVAWWDNTPGDYDILFSRSTNDGASFSPIQNISHNAGSSGPPVMIIDSSGNIDLAWPDATVGGGDILFTTGISLPFYDFPPPKLKVQFGPPPGFQLKADFALDPSSDGIFPITEPLVLLVGPYSATIPPGAFSMNKKGWFTFAGIISGANLSVRITPLGSNSYQLQAAASGASVTRAVNPVRVLIEIGNDGGATSTDAVFQ